MIQGFIIINYGITIVWLHSFKGGLRMAKFRNVVGVDAEIVMAILTKHLNDVQQYRGAILAYLNRPVL